MICPKCYGKTTVYDSREQDNGTVKRYRTCRECKARFVTVETIIPPHTEEEGERKQCTSNS